MVLSIPPKHSVSNIMGFLKGKLALKLFDKCEKLNKRYWGCHFWSRGYCVCTVGLNEEQIRKYVKWQQKKITNLAVSNSIYYKTIAPSRINISSHSLAVVVNYFCLSKFTCQFQIVTPLN